MARITRQRLSRGTKLNRQSVFDVLDDAAAVLSGAVEADNLSERYGTFRVNLTVPFIDALYFGRTDNTFTRFAVPFMLPPLQQFFDGVAGANEATPEIRLVELQFSCDQRQEPGAIASDQNALTTTHGQLYEGGIEAYDFKVSVVSRQQWIFGNPTFVPDREIASIELPPEVFAARNFRLNPAVVEVNSVVDPYATLMLVLDGRSLNTSGVESMLVSPTFSLKFRYQLHAGSSGQNDVQNLPMCHQNTPTPATVVISTPAAGSLITADAAQGVQTNIRTLDRVLHTGLDGGASQGGDIPVTEHIAHDTCYEVIACPMFAGYGQAGFLTAAEVTAGNAPNPLGPPFAENQRDEAVIPLYNPLIIHHCYAVANYAAPTGGGANTGGLRPGGTLINDVAVGIGVGRAADNHTYQLVAGASWTVASKVAMTVDRIAAMAGSTNTAHAEASRWDYELIHLPLVIGPQGEGVGHYDQGKPFYVGWPHSRMWDRSGVGDGNTDVPWTNGAEQFLSLRWSFHDPNGLGSAEGAAGPQDTYFGAYGHWIIIIAEKPTVGYADDSFPQ